MSGFKSLLLMQLKEKLDLGFLKSKKQILFKVVFSVLIFALITAISYLVLWLCRFLNLFSALNHIPLSFMAFVYFVIFVLNTITCTIGLSKTLYYSKDNQMLVTLPVNPNALFLSKMLVYFISEIKKCFTFAIPIFVAYGIISSFSFVYFIWAPIMLVLLSAIPVLIGGLLSIPTNYIMAFFKKYPILRVIALAILLALLVAGVVWVIGIIPEDINLIRSWSVVARGLRNFLDAFTTIFSPFYYVAVFLCGTYENMQAVLFTNYSYIVLLIVIAIISILVVLNLITSRPLYLKLITRQFEFDKKTKVKKHKNEAFGPLNSTIRYEAKKNFRDTELLSTSISTIIIAPIAVLLLNTIYSAINTRLLGDYLTICFNLLVILLFVLAHNINASSLYSRDGEALQLNKTKPSSAFKILFPRLFYNFLFTVIILVVTSSIFFSYSTLSVGNCILLFFTMLFVAMIHLVWSAELDFLKPSGAAFKTNGIAGVNPNELKSTLLSFLLSGITFAICLFFLLYESSFVYLRVFLIALSVLALRIYLFYTKSKTLLREM